MNDLRLQYLYTVYLYTILNIWTINPKSVKVITDGIEWSWTGVSLSLSLSLSLFQGNIFD